MDSTHCTASHALHRILPIVMAALVAILAGPPAIGRATPVTDAVPLPDVTETAGQLGACYAFYEVDGKILAPTAYAAGARWDRFDFRWNIIEGEDVRLSPLFFDAHDTVVNRDVSAGLNVIGILGSTPAWAAPTCHVAAQALPPTVPALTARPLSPLLADDDPVWWRPCPPVGLDLPWNDPGNVWGNYVYQTVLHFKDRVHTWEIWNEPDLGGTFWTGTVAQYAQLLRVGYQAVKAADPDATVLFAGLAYWYDPTYYVAVLDALRTLPDAGTHNYYFDVLSLHLYSNIYTFGPVAAKIGADMAARVGAHPIWLTETGVPLWDEWTTLPDPPPSARINRASAEEAAAYVIEGYSEARASGIEKFVFFRTHDDGMRDGDYTSNFGLIRDDLTFRPSYVAFQVAARYLYGENQITGPLTNDGVRRVTFWGTPRGRIDVLWNTAGMPITYTRAAVVPTATLVDHRGVTATLTAQAGAFTLTLDPATANTAVDGGYIVGGPPLLLIQEDTQPPQSALQPLPAVTYGSPVTLTWTVGDQPSGYWYEEIERSHAATGPWEAAGGWPATAGVTTTAVPAPAAGTWYFRARARDNVGNWEAWPATTEVSTTVWLTSTVHLSVTTYLDANGNGTWDLEDPAETPTTTTALRWLDGNGTLVAQTVGASWEITRTVEGGQHTLTAAVPDHLPATTSFPVTPSQTPVTVTLTLGIRPVRGRAYLPLICRHQ